MSSAYAKLAFTPAVRAMQERMGSRRAYARLDDSEDLRATLTAREAEFIARADSFYQATVSETGWPYVQHRGGPAGFLKVLDAQTIGYADVRGNRQYISVGNLEGDDRVALILMDYPRRQRLKILGRARVVDRPDASMLARFTMPRPSVPVERIVSISVDAFDWNCPQHITPRFTEAEIGIAVAPLHEEIAHLRAELAKANNGERLEGDAARTTAPPTAAAIVPPPDR